MPGRLIALEGIDGSGTTTQLRRLAQALQSRGEIVHTTAEPSAGPVGLLIREALTKRVAIEDAPLALLFAADRLDHVAREIRPALARGETVLTDRYLLSSLAYQSLGSDVGWVRAINQQAPAPDLTLFFRVAPAIAAQRRRERGGEAERFETADTQARVAEAYEAFLKWPEAGRAVVVVDAALPVEQVTAKLLDALGSAR